MAKKNEIVSVEATEVLPVEQIENLIIDVRGKQVMLDRDLAMLYGVETKRLNEQVQRNIERFPEDFMFQLTKEEFENWKSQIVISDSNGILKSQFATSKMKDEWKSQFATSNSIKMGARKRPYAFTENGIAMLSGVLRSPQAVSTNIRIMRAFTAMRHFIGAHAQMFQRLEVMERNQLALNAHIEEYQADTDKKFEEVFRRLDDGSITPAQGVFYDGQVFDAYRFVADRIREAKSRIVLFDNYANDEVLTLLDKRGAGVAAKIYIKRIEPQFQLDISRHNAQYPAVDVELFDRSHDRFLCVDDTVYHLGASLKDLGKRWFAFCRMEISTDELLSKI